MIFEGVKGQFKNAKVRSKLILFSTDLDDIQQYKNVHCHHTTLLVQPDFSKVSTLELYMLEGQEILTVNLDVYVENMFYREAFDSVSFDKVEPLENWMEKMSVWKKMKETMRPISEYFR